MAEIFRESKVFKITNIVGNVVTVDGPILLDTYVNMMRVNDIEYDVIYTLDIVNSNTELSIYYVGGDLTSILIDNSSIVVTDTNGYKFYDVILETSYNAGDDETTITTSIGGVILSEISTFEVTNHIVDSSYCGTQKVYTGTNSSAMVNESQVLSFPYAEQQDNAIGIYNLIAGDFKYFVIPESFTVLGFFVNEALELSMHLGYPNNVIEHTEFSYYELTVAGVACRVYRSLNILTGSIVIRVE